MKRKGTQEGWGKRVGHASRCGDRVHLRRLREAGKINFSLSVLGSVMRELAEGATSSARVPYRDSKLTFLLMESLGERGRAALIATLSPQPAHAAETKSTLAFAALSRRVKQRPAPNEEAFAARGKRRRDQTGRARRPSSVKKRCKGQGGRRRGG